MNRSFVLTATMAAAVALQAQDANPISANMKQSWTNVKGLLTRMADQMPDDNYTFKPAADVQDSGQRMAQGSAFNMRGCAAVKGDQKSINLGATATKAESLGAMKEANDACDVVFNSL